MIRAVKDLLRPWLKSPAGRVFARAVLQRPDYTAEIRSIIGNPLDAHCHLTLAKKHLSNKSFFAGWALLKCARWLADSNLIPSIDTVIAQARPHMPNINQISHNTFFRLDTISKAIEQISDGQPLSVIDVGGGDGKLACFLRDAHGYFLAEPKVNGIRGESLPFDKKQFDIVVSCHVLEHVPKNERDDFLNSLVDQARRAVILLNPFEIDGGKSTERLELIYSITKSEWAKEHLDCELPTVESVADYARKRGIQFEIKPNGSLTSSLPLVFADYFAIQSGRQEHARVINEFMNGLEPELFECKQYPNAYLVVLHVTS